MREKSLYWFVQNDLRYELQDVLSGKSQVRFGTIIQTIAGYLKNGETTSSAIEDTKHFKSEETKRLEEFITQNSFWINKIYLSKQNFRFQPVEIFFHFGNKGLPKVQLSMLLL